MPLPPNVESLVRCQKVNGVERHPFQVVSSRLQGFGDVGAVGGDGGEEAGGDGEED